MTGSSRRLLALVASLVFIAALWMAGARRAPLTRQVGADSLVAAILAPTDSQQPAAFPTCNPDRLGVVRLVVDESYPGAPDLTVLADQVTSRLLTCIGLETSRSDTDNYQWILKIHLRGRPLGANYSSLEGLYLGYCYSGASVHGSISLKAPSTSGPGNTFDGISAPPGFVSACSRWLGDAPYTTAWANSDFVYKLATALRRQFGPEALSWYLPAVLAESAWGLPYNEGAFAALLKIGAPAVDRLIAALGSPAWGVRYRAAHALGMIADSHATAALTGLLKDPEFMVRLVANFALVKLGDATRLDSLVDALHDPSGSLEAASLLGETGERRAIAPLMAVVRSNGRAWDALERLTGRDFGDDPERWLEWWETHRRR